MIGSSFIDQPCLAYSRQKDESGILKTVPVLSKANFSGGALGTAGSLISGIYANRPVRSDIYLASVFQDLGIVKDAKAEVIGSGAKVLDPIYNLWQVSRNIAYIVMVIVFVVIGLMVMFRSKINPQTVISAQAAIPGLILGLVLITISYFLAGLISDMAFVGTNLVGSYFSQVSGKPEQTQNILNAISTENAVSIFSKYTNIINKDNATEAITPIYNSLDDSEIISPKKILSSFAGLLAAQMIMPVAGLFGGVGQLVGGITAAAFTSLNSTAMIGFAVTLAALAILLYSMFRLIFRLLTAYLGIIFMVITAPFQFLIASMPGRQEIATTWIRNMLANVLIFPSVLAVFYFVAYILGQDFGPIKIADVSGAVSGGGIISPVYAQSGSPIQIGSGTVFPLLGGLNLEFLRTLLAFVALVATPTIPDIIVKSIGKPSEAGHAAGQGVFAVIGAGRGYSDQATKGLGGFAERFGNLKDQPLRWAEQMPDPSDPNKQITVWRESKKSIAGIGSPTMGGLSKLRYSNLGNMVFGKKENSGANTPTTPTTVDD
jgi:hypothetical protein